MTEECTLDQGQALKYLRILGKKLRAHYFFHSTPMASTEPANKCPELAWGDIEVSNCGNISPFQFSAGVQTRFEGSDPAVFPDASNSQQSQERNFSSISEERSKFTLNERLSSVTRSMY